jgi:hypothetical protein
MWSLDAKTHLLTVERSMAKRARAVNAHPSPHFSTEWPIHRSLAGAMPSSCAEGAFR